MIPSPLTSEAAMREVSVWRRLRLFGRFTWRFMRTGDERWMDVAVFALHSRRETPVALKAMALGFTQMGEEFTRRLMPTMRRAAETIGRFQEAALQEPPATEVVEGEGMRR